ncbi:hypothetical protein OsJ_23560 [Oryza sativa Japonica Group]|uniref:Uncharacterized protein n=2 Tax=Oryza sativa subsp. japonica TaxID=39947 RepID=B9FW71_ORYSJ|nr:hypothetical protein OsJ_23560 [Oryza sativa Japonica Group]
MAELMRSPRVMAKVQAEMRQAFQGKNTITEDDLAQLSYLKMVLKESFRLHCPVPLLSPRKCRETCKIMGYDVPKGTSVFVNVWAICRDSMYWKNAEEFKPERFEDNDIELKGSNFKFLPFGSGRRICPGINLGWANMEFALANLLYHFDWNLPDGMLHKDLDMQESPGLVAAKCSDLNIWGLRDFKITYVPEQKKHIEPTYIPCGNKVVSLRQVPVMNKCIHCLVLVVQYTITNLLFIPLYRFAYSTVRLTQSRQQHPAAEGVSLGTTEGLQAKTLRLLLEVELLQHQAP